MESAILNLTEGVSMNGKIESFFTDFKIHMATRGMAVVRDPHQWAAAWPVGTLEVAERTPGEVAVYANTRDVRFLRERSDREYDPDFEGIEVIVPMSKLRRIVPWLVALCLTPRRPSDVRLHIPD